MPSSITQCFGCPYRERGKGFVPGKGPLDAKVAFIGRGPDSSDVFTSEPFTGTAGTRLDIWFAKANIPRSKCWMGGAVQCQLKVRGKDAAPPKAIAECYQRHWGQPLLAMLEAGTLQTIVTVGSEASRFLCGKWAGDRAAGSLVEVELPTLASVPNLGLG